MLYSAGSGMCLRWSPRAAAAKNCKLVFLWKLAASITYISHGSGSQGQGASMVLRKTLCWAAESPSFRMVGKEPGQLLTFWVIGHLEATYLLMVPPLNTVTWD